MSQRRLPDRRALDTVLEALGRLLPFVPARFRPVAVAALALAAAIVTAYYVAPGPQPATYTAVALTIDPATPGLTGEMVIRIRRDTGAVLAVQPAAEAPLNAWFDRNIATGTTQVWCLAGADVEAAAIMRGHLDALSAAYPTDGGRAGFRWREACPGAYRLTDQAGVHCGIGNDAVACASPEAWDGQGYRGGHLSYNGAYRRYTLSGGREGVGPGLDAGGLRVALAHELGHVPMSRDHTAQGYGLPSVMGPVYIPSGPSSSNPPAYGIDELIQYDLTGPDPYGLGVRVTGPGIQRTPTPPPVATPTPALTCAHLQQWVWRDGWVITDLARACQPVAETTWFVTVVAPPAGEWRFSEFLQVDGP